MKYTFKTDAESGTIEACSMEDALDKLDITQAMIDDGAWAWVEDENGERRYIAEENYQSMVRGVAN